MSRIGQAAASLSRPAQLAGIGIVLTVLVLGGWTVRLRAADVSQTVPAAPDGSLDPAPGADEGGAPDGAGDVPGDPGQAPDGAGDVSGDADGAPAGGGAAPADPSDDRDGQGDAAGGSGGPCPDGEPGGQKTDSDDSDEAPDPDPPRQPEGSPA